MSEIMTLKKREEEQMAAIRDARTEISICVHAYILSKIYDAMAELMKHVVLV